MKTIRKTFLTFVIFTILLSTIQAQNLTNTPYSRFGVGDLSSKGFSQNLGLGGSGIGLRSPFYINPINPASSSVYGLSRFIFDVGIGNHFSVFTTSSDKQYANSTNLEYLAAAFAIKKWWGTSIGLMPYSSVGYKINDNKTYILDQDTISFTNYYAGEGGIFQVFWDNSFKFFNFVAVGIKTAYMFGSLDRNYVASLNDTRIASVVNTKNRNLISGFKYSAGIQIFDTIKNSNDKAIISFVIGATFDNDANIHVKNTMFVSRTTDFLGNITVDTLQYNEQNNGYLTIPQGYGAGASVTVKNKLTMAFDYYQQQWSKATLLGENLNLRDTKYMCGGIEYVRDPYSTRYLRTIRYRIGVRYSDSYIYLNDTKFNEYAISAGIGLPTSASLINLNFEFGTKGTTDNNLIKEDYILFNINLSLYDLWFVKRKYR